MSTRTKSLEFRFKFVDDGHAHGPVQNGIVDLQGLRLLDTQIPYVAIRTAEFHRARLTFHLDAGQISDLQRPYVRQNWLTISVSSAKAADVCLWVERQLTEMAALAAHSHTDHCRLCQARIDLDQLPSSAYLYCPECERFSRKSAVTGESVIDPDPGNASLSQCDACSYFGRTHQCRPEHVPLQHSNRLNRTTVNNICDSCLSSPSAGITTAQYSPPQKDTLWYRLARANSLAARLQLGPAFQTYYGLTGSNEFAIAHPGILFNQALAYTEAGYTTKAEIAVHKALKACSNYPPALTLRMKLKSLV